MKDSGRIFDLTKSEIAKEKGIFNPQQEYKPVKIIVGEGNVIKGVDEVLEGAEVGKKIKINIPPEKAFGKRDPSLIKLIPLTEFKKQNLTPRVGQVISFEDGSTAKIISVGGGRVKMDMNHPLAGKELSYELEVKRIIKDKAERAKAYLEMVFGSYNTNFGVLYNKEKDIITINGNSEIDEKVMQEMIKNMKEKIKDVKDIVYVPNKK